MSSFDHIAIIYNPQSTGDAEQLSRQLQSDLQQVQIAAELLPTEYAGHAEVLAYQHAVKRARPLIVSVSGDGGYNEVINGALKARAAGIPVVSAVLPAGNANDHARHLYDRSLAELIAAGKTRRIDALQLSLKTDGQTFKRFAHSYVGFGLTSAVAVELNKTSLSRWRESLIFIRTLSTYRPVRFRYNDREHVLDSLICSTINGMAKFFTISQTAQPDDGRFELTTLPHHQKLKLYLYMLRGITRELGAYERTDKFTGLLRAAAPVQYDGETKLVSAGTSVEVTILPGGLETLVAPDQTSKSKYEG